MADRFAKLYDTKLGQILIKLDTDAADRPEVRVYCRPADLGVCSVAFAFSSDESGWEKAQECFAEFNEEGALKIARDLAEGNW